MNQLLRLLLLLLLLGLLAAFYYFDLGQYFNLQSLKSRQAELQAFYLSSQWQMIAVFSALYVVMAALSLPGAAIMTIAAGVIFGLGLGTVIVSFASSIGATLAFLVARFILREQVQQRFADKLKAINAGVEKEGEFYLFTLRLIPLFPFFLINLLMGLTPIKTWKFYLVSQLGMLPGTLVYVNAGEQVASLESLAGILSPSLLLSFALLGLFPLLAKKLIDWLKARQYSRRYKRPRRFDYNLIVIGAGSGGLVSAYIAAAVKAKVLLIEKHKMGGDCLNTGCVPSKALIRSAKMLSYAARAKEFGFHSARVDYDFAEVMQRVQSVITQVEPHDSIERYQSLGVEVEQGEAQLLSPYEVSVNNKRFSARHIIIASGARPFVPEIPGLDQIDYLTSDTLWQLRQRPQRLLVLGGGSIGCELAQSFQRLGCQVCVVERNTSLLAREDDDVAALVQQRFAEEGVNVCCEHTALRFERHGQEQVLICEHKGEHKTMAFDKVLVALGRRANVEGFGLEQLGIKLSPQGTISADSFLRTNYPNIFVVGDVTGPYQFTHVASHQAWYAAVNALFGQFKKFAVDYSVIPWASYTDPEVARVGMNEKEARAQGVAYEVSHYGIDDLDRALADSEAHGMVKVLTVPGKDKILGVCIVGQQAGELIAEFVLAMKHGLGLNKILGTIHIYPTMAEANKYVAGVWKKNHQPEGLLRWVARYHAWRR